MVLAILWMVPISMHGQDDPFADGKASVVPLDDSSKVFPDPAGKEYFPKGKASYYTRYLAAMREPSLQRDLEGLEDFHFRFTYLRSFQDPLMVRGIKVGNTLKMRAVILKMGANSEPIGIAHDGTVSFAVDEAKNVLEELQKREFWKPLNDAEKFCEGLDGSQWVFEFRDKNGYRMIDVWSPNLNVVPDGIDLPKLLKDAGLKVEEVRNYKVYVDVGYELLRMADILPDPNL
jgi:hypothetical protein